MSKLKRIIQFILALLNFLFHFKPSPDDTEEPETAGSYPRALPAGPAGFEPLPETDPTD